MEGSAGQQDPSSLFFKETLSRNEFQMMGQEEIYIIYTIYTSNLGEEKKIILVGVIIRNLNGP